MAPICLRCPQCSGYLNVEDGRDIYYCPYCGSKVTNHIQQDKHVDDYNKGVEAYNLLAEKEIKKYAGEINKKSRKKDFLRFVVGSLLVASVISIVVLLTVPSEEEGISNPIVETSDRNNEVEMICVTPEYTEDEMEEILEIEKAMKGTKHGSAANLAGATVILSFLTDDADTSWNGDEEIIEQTRRNLMNATDWIVEECKQYGASPSIICDWSQDETLLSKAKFTQTLVREDTDMYKYQEAWLDTHFPIEDIKQEYGVDNVIYLFLFNTPYENVINSWALEWNPINKDTEYEIMNAYVRYDYVDLEASALAHEILHMFGAPDMYYANEVINQSYVDYCNLTDSRDIMFRTNMGEAVEEKFTELDAYYVGLIERPSAVTDWNLALSEYEE